jgi:tetratricopeptide (TPR) repeat protein
MSRSKHTNGKPHRAAQSSNTDYDAYDRFLDELEAHPDSVSGVGRPENERRMIAERLLDSALDSSDPMRAMTYALRAVRLDPACLDARMFLALAAQGPKDELLEELQAIVAVGEADLGAEVFTENKGMFWGILETRPYMRVRSCLARELYRAGLLKEAIRHYEEMLKLNPNDNQGLRYPLLGHYLESHDLDGTRRLFAEYEGEAGAMFAWGRVLERYLAVNFSDALQALKHARKENAYVEEFITGLRKLPKIREDFYSPGDVTEAIACMDVIGAAWNKYPEAVQWLKKEQGTGHLSTKNRTRK